jgi:hypothetical protein
MNPVPYAVSILWGALTGLGLWLLTIPLSLGEMGGPINWAVTYIAFSGLMLALTTYTARARHALGGASCGILFSAPIAGVSYVVSHADDTVLREHGGQLKFAAIVAVALSVLVMGAVAGFRRTSHSDDGTDTKP